MQRSDIEAEWADRSIETKRALFVSDRFVSFRVQSKRNDWDPCRFDRYNLSKPKCSVDSIRFESNRSWPRSFRSIKFRLSSDKPKIGKRHRVSDIIVLWESSHPYYWIRIRNCGSAHKELRDRQQRDSLDRQLRHRELLYRHPRIWIVSVEK